MSEFWNQRYSLKEYAYGKEPNQFFKAQIANQFPGKILFPAEGEGRNAVFAAKQGWDVYAFDNSVEAKRKAEMLACEHSVQINYQLSSLENAEYPLGYFDCIVSIFAHFNPFKRNEFHNKLISFLKPGGTFILEGFSKKQFQFDSGGPRNIEMLFSAEEISDDFKNLSELTVKETEINLDEGNFHQGMASVIRMVGTR